MLSRPTRCVILCLLIALTTPAVARGDESRFGDSTWVAPYSMTQADSEPTDNGPRVAKPDRMSTAETVLRFPFRVVFYPFRLVARGAESAVGLVSVRYDPQKEYRVLPTFSISGTAGPGLGIRLKPPSVIRDDWYGTFRVSYSWNDHRHLSIEQRFGEPTVFLGLGVDAAYRYEPNLRFYGIGNSSDGDDRAIYLEEEGRLDAFLRIGTERLQQLRIRIVYSNMDIGRGYNGSPFVEDEFTPESVPFFGRGSSVVEYGIGGDLALVDDLNNPSRGVHGRGDFRWVDGVSSSSNLEYIRWHLEGRSYLPVFSFRRVIALRAVYQGVDPREGSEPVPYYRLPESNRETRFAAYKTPRFSDQQLLLAHAEYRWLVWEESLWAVALAQWGAVAPDEKSFRISDGHESYGLGLRLGRKNRTTYRAEIAHGAEGFSAHVDLSRDF